MDAHSEMRELLSKAPGPQVVGSAPPAWTKVVYTAVCSNEHCWKQFSFMYAHMKKIGDGNTLQVQCPNCKLSIVVQNNSKQLVPYTGAITFEDFFHKSEIPPPKNGGYWDD